MDFSGVAADDIATIAEGGVPTNTRLKKLVTASTLRGATCMGWLRPSQAN